MTLFYSSQIRYSLHLIKYIYISLLGDLFKESKWDFFFLFTKEKQDLLWKKLFSHLFILVSYQCMLNNLRYAFLNDTGQEPSIATGHERTYFSCLLKPRERLRRREQGRGRQAQGALTHLHNFRAWVSFQSLLRGVDHGDLHQCIQLPITNGGHKILACWQWQQKEKEKLTRCLREKFCPELEVNLATALKEISWDSGWFLQRKSLGSTLQK